MVNFMKMERQGLTLTTLDSVQEVQEVQEEALQQVLHQCDACGLACEVRRCSCGASYCSTGCQRSAWSSHRSSCSPWQVRTSPTGGLGMFATRTVAAGTALLTEAPLLVTMGAATDGDDAGAAREDWRRLLLLGEEQGRQVLDLADPWLLDTVTNAALEGEEEVVVKLARILATNGLEGHDGATRLYRRVSRLNHSCRPNVLVVAGDVMGEVVVKASRRVHKGEELLFKYVGQLEGRHGRRRELEEHWHFLCSCQVCSLPEEESRENDRRRRVITSFLTEGTEETEGMHEMEEMEGGQDRRMVRGLEALACCFSIKEEARHTVFSQEL